LCRTDGAHQLIDGHPTVTVLVERQARSRKYATRCSLDAHDQFPTVTVKSTLQSPGQTASAGLHARSNITKMDSAMDLLLPHFIAWSPSLRIGS
jgi:hypothetical protein